MQFLSLSRRRTEAFPPEAFAELAPLETRRAKELYISGVLRQVWKRSDVAGAAIVWEAASESDARAALESLPMFQAGMLETLGPMPLEPYPGFAPDK